MNRLSQMNTKLNKLEVQYATEHNRELLIINNKAYLKDLNNSLYKTTYPYMPVGIYINQKIVQCTYNMELCIEPYI